MSKNIKDAFEEEVVMVTASSEEALLAALDNKNFVSNPQDPYRLVLFDPTKDRINKAKKLISKGNPWRGRQDIWFSNQSLLKGDAKVAFLFPGFDPTANPEIDSVLSYFELSLPETKVKDNELLAHAFKLFHSSGILDSVLKNIGVKPDLNAGHSLGEWFAAKAGGLMSDETVEKLLLSIDPERVKIDNAYFIAVGCGIKRIEAQIGGIKDLYLSNDNCTNQILFCGTSDARDQLVDILKDEKIFHQVLPFQSGFHSPFIKDKLDVLDDSLENVTLLKNEIPIWSATTLDVYPYDFKLFKELTIKHLLQTVRFRELIEKLYEEQNVKMFIQLGVGSLVGFIDDTLKGKEYAAISTCIPTRNTLEQLRRVLALLFIEGKPIDSTLLQTTPCKEEIISQPLQNIPSEQEVPVLQNKNWDSLMIKSSHPIIQALNENVKEILLMQEEVMNLMEKGFIKRSAYSTAIAVNTSIEPVEVKISKTGSTFEVPIQVAFKEHSYLIDHALTKQPKDWPVIDDYNPVIPMTMTFELLIEAAHKQDISRKVLRLGPVSVFQWMAVSDIQTFSQTINGNWKSEDLLSVGIKNFATGEVKLGDAFPVIPLDYEGEIDLGKSIMTSPTPEEIYAKHMFHGPKYQGIIEIQEVTDKGMRGLVKHAGGKGSLLDTIGQMYGLYLQLTLTGESVSFPVKVDEINFYQDVYDQKGVFECICIQTSLTNEFSIGDIIIKREGKIWCIVRGWKNRRFEGFDKHLWNLTMSPSNHVLAKEIAPDVYFYDNAYSKAVNWEFIGRTYLNQQEKKYHKSLPLNKQRGYLISRIALKDGVRSYLEKRTKKHFFPIEVTVEYDDKNKPNLVGREEVAELEVSLGHKGNNSVSITSDKPVGIDIELIEERTQGFVDMSFTKNEQKLFAGRDISEWSTRFWVAKEAYGKMLGVGLQGNPKQYEVSKIEEEDLVINNVKIKTIKYNDKFIIGWTQ